MRLILALVLAVIVVGCADGNQKDEAVWLDKGSIIYIVDLKRNMCFARTSSSGALVRIEGDGCMLLQKEAVGLARVKR